MNRNRKLCFVAFLLCACLLFSGCIQSNVSVTVNKDRSMDFSATYLVTDSMANMTTSQETTLHDVDKDSPNWKTLEKRGYKVEACKESGFTGFKATRHIHSIDTVSKETGVGVTLWKNTDENFLSENFDDSTLFSVKREFFKDTYTAHFFYDLSPDATGANDQESGEDLSSYFSEIEASYTVTLPYKAIGHNATSVSQDGLTYTWKVPYGRPTAIDYSFSMPSRNVLYCIVGGAALILIIVAVVVLLLVRKKHKKPAEENADLPAPKTPEEAAALMAKLQPAPAQPQPAPAQPQPTPMQPQPTPAQPQPTPAQPQPAPAQPQPAPAQPQPTPVQPQPIAPATPKPQNVCPLCGGKLTVRVAKTGPQAGAKYAVCEHYPAGCKFAKPIQ